MQSSLRQLPSRSMACAMESLVYAPAGSAVIVVCRCADVIERFDSSGDSRIHQSECLSLCFVCRLPGLVVPVGRGIELTIDRLALRNIGVRNWLFLPEKSSMTMMTGAE